MASIAPSPITVSAASSSRSTLLIAILPPSGEAKHEGPDRASSRGEVGERTMRPLGLGAVPLLVAVSVYHQADQRAARSAWSGGAALSFELGIDGGRRGFQQVLDLMQAELLHFGDRVFKQVLDRAQARPFAGGFSHVRHFL